MTEISLYLPVAAKAVRSTGRYIEVEYRMRLSAAVRPELDLTLLRGRVGT